MMKRGQGCFQRWGRVGLTKCKKSPKAGAVAVVADKCHEMSVLRHAVQLLPTSVILLECVEEVCF
jgi:hypothetical protein